MAREKSINRNGKQEDAVKHYKGKVNDEAEPMSPI